MMCDAARGQGLVHLCYLTQQCSIYDNYSRVCVIVLMTVVTDQNHDNKGTHGGTAAFFVDFCLVN